MALAVLALTCCEMAAAQIGGKTAANGPFSLEDAEDRDLTAGGVSRNWVVDVVKGEDQPLIAFDPTSATLGLTLDPGQSPIGALRFRTPTFSGYINYSFGVPMPSVVGASTLTNPGNITSFERLTFRTCSSIALTSQTFQVMLECYPETSPGVFPKLIWSYSSPIGTTFTNVVLNLRAPTSVANNPSNLTVEQLLAQTRYLAFYNYAGPEATKKTLDFYLDDVRLAVTPLATVNDWALYE